MQNRNLFFVAAALGSASLVSSFTGCSSSSGTNASPDSGTASDTGTGSDTSAGDDSSAPVESGAQDSGTTTKTDGGDSGVATLNCNVGTAPQGTKLVGSNTASVQGLTSDGFAYFYDSSLKTLNSVSVAGGTPTMVSAFDNSSALYVSGKLAVWTHGASTATATSPSIGPVLVSASGAAQKTVSTAAYQSQIGGGYIDVSADSNYVLYTQNATATSADIYVSAPDGTNAVKLVSGAIFNANANGVLCDPNARFVGNTVVVAYCATAPSSQLSSTIAQFNLTGGAPIQTFTTAGFYGFSIDNFKTPTKIAYTTASGQYVQSLTPASAPVLIDPYGAGGATFTADGLSLIYFEFVPNDAGGGSGGIYRSTIASPAPQLITAGNYLGTLATSADTNWLVTYQQQDSNTGFTDMYLTSTAAGSTPSILCPTANGGFFGDNFTIDQSRTLFFCNIALQGSGYVGDFDDEKLLAGATVNTVVPTTVWQENAVSGTKVLYNDRYTGGGPVYGYADIESTDVAASPLAPTTLVSHADANYYVTADKKTVVYSFSACPNLGPAGVYALTIP